MILANSADLEAGGGRAAAEPVAGVVERPDLAVGRWRGAVGECRDDISAARRTQIGGSSATRPGG